MPQTFVVDQTATFTSVVLLSCEPKLAFGSDQQDKDKDGTPKWELQLVGGFRQFGRTQNEVIKVGVASHYNPADSIPLFTPVALSGFQVGVMERTKNGEVVGAQVWYRCEGIRPANALPNGHAFKDAKADAKPETAKAS